MRRKLFLLVLLIIIFFPRLTYADAQIYDQTPSQFERLQEKIVLFFKFKSLDKSNYYLHIMDNRLSELKYAVDNNKLDLVTETSSRYQTYVANFESLYFQSDNSTLGGSVQKMTTNHLNLLPHLRDQFASNSAWWLMIQQDIDSIKKLSLKIGS